MHAVLHHKAVFLSEDLAITDGVHLYACPWTSTFRYYDELSMSWLLRMRMRLIKIFPLVELLPAPGGSRTIDSYIKQKDIGVSNKVTHVAILARRSGGVEVIDKKRASKMVWNLNRYEFVYMKNPMLTSYSYFNPELDVESLVERERAILSKLVENTTCLLVQSENAAGFSGLILDAIKK
jgi:hypothetical protein